MFNFTTTTIINKDLDYTNPSSKLIFTHDTNAKLAADEILIKRLGKFKKTNILSITKAAYEPASVLTSTITVPAVTSNNVYRLKIYVRLSGSLNSYYANDFVYKGKPFYIEAIAPSGEGTALATELVKNTKNYMLTVYENKLLDITSSGTTLTIKGTDCHQIITEATLQHWNEKTNTWEFVAKQTVTNPSTPGFGTYSHLMQNYVLPTGANLRFAHIVEDETPMINGNYTQYIIRMCTNRGVMGGDAVGQPVQSITTHCIWAEAGVITPLETALKKLQGTLTNVDKLTSSPEPVFESKLDKGLSGKQDKA